MEGIAGHRLLSARSAVALGALAFVLNIAALVLVCFGWRGRRSADPRR